MWLSCARIYNFDPKCRDAYGRPLALDECIRLLDFFIGFACGLLQLKPISVSGVYIPGIAAHFAISRDLSNFRMASNHECIKYILKGYEKMWTKRHPDHQKAKIPFTMILAQQAEDFLRAGSIHIPGFYTTRVDHHADMDIRRLSCALMFGIFFLLRKGEFLPHPDKQPISNHIMLRSNLRFLNDDQSEIPYGSIGKARAYWLSITIVFSKTDQTGRGRIVTHYVDTTQPRYCIVQRMEAYIASSRDLYHAAHNDPLFHIPGFATLTTGCITTLMRTTCRLLGLPDDKISAHSLRYGGATTLAAAGFPEYIIAFYGGWAPNSSAMRTYIQVTPDTVKKVSHHMSHVQASLAVQSVVNHLIASRVPVWLDMPPPRRRSRHN